MQSLPPWVELIDAGTCALDLISFFEQKKTAILIDAVSGGDAPGTIYRLSLNDLNQKSPPIVSLHSLKIEHAAKLWQLQLDPLPDIIILGVEPKEVRIGLELSKQVKEALIDIDLFTGSVLRGNSSIRGEILRYSIGENSYLYEFMVRLNDIYDEIGWANFQKLISFRQIPNPSQILPVKSLFRKLYILGQYRTVCKVLVYKAIEIQEKYKKAGRETIDRLKKGLGGEIDLVLGPFLQKLHILLCRIEGRYLALYSQKLDDYLELTAQDKIGYITRLEKRRRIETLKKAKESLRKAHEAEKARPKEEIKIPKHVERGLLIVEDAIRSYEKEHEGAEPPLRYLDKRDKMYRTLVLLDRFDSQYSFVLTTSKIIYNIDYVEQKKVDIKEDLNHAYILFNEAREEAKGYLETTNEAKNIRDDRRLTQYQLYARLEKLEKKKLNSGRKSRKRVSQVMKLIEEILSTVITDYKGEKILLQNPEEYLRFDPNIDGHKKLDGNRIIEAIVETFLFSATFAFLLNYGELSGAGMYIEGENVPAQDR